MLVLVCKFWPRLSVCMYQVIMLYYLDVIFNQILSYGIFYWYSNYMLLTADNVLSIHWIESLWSGWNPTKPTIQTKLYLRYHSSHICTSHTGFSSHHPWMIWLHILNYILYVWIYKCIAFKLYLYDHSPLDDANLPIWPRRDHSRRSGPCLKCATPWHPSYRYMFPPYICTYKCK